MRIITKKRVRTIQASDPAEFGTVTDFTPACEWFYKQVLQGKIVPEED